MMDAIPAQAVKQYRPIEELIPSHWTQSEIAVNGVRLHLYRTGGQKPPLLLLHGILEGALTWLRTARLLEADYDVIMVDARSHGRSSRAATTFTHDRLVEDAAGVIRTLAISPAYVVGHSLGGAVGILLAHRHPELVRALVVEGWADDALPNPAQTLAQSEGYRRWLDSYIAWLEQLQHQSHAERMVASLGQLPAGAPLPPEEDYVPWVEYSANLDLDLVRLGAALWSRLHLSPETLTEALAGVRCPVLLLKSAFFPQPGASRAIREEPSDQPNVRIVRFEGTGHLIHREQPEPFVELIREFLAARRPAPPDRPPIRPGSGSAPRRAAPTPPGQTAE
ncbi:MAG TPA: alpha/beta hydrolase [Caldilineaceae bacterium]|nr:alpha/beta hydrolase [Caldilineaceae bacterium]